MAWYSPLSMYFSRFGWGNSILAFTDTVDNCTHRAWIVLVTIWELRETHLFVLQNGLLQVTCLNQQELEGVTLPCLAYLGCFPFIFSDVVCFVLNLNTKKELLSLVVFDFDPVVFSLWKKEVWTHGCAYRIRATSWNPDLCIRNLLPFSPTVCVLCF